MYGRGSEGGAMNEKALGYIRDNARYPDTYACLNRRMVTNDRVLILWDGDITGLAPFKCSASVSKMLDNFKEWHATEIESLRAWCGSAEYTREIQCPDCNGTGIQDGDECWCNEGKEFEIPETRAGSILDVLLNKNLLAQGLAAVPDESIELARGTSKKNKADCMLCVRGKTWTIIVTGLRPWSVGGEIPTFPLAKEAAHGH